LSISCRAAWCYNCFASALRATMPSSTGPVGAGASMGSSLEPGNKMKYYRPVIAKK